MPKFYVSEHTKRKYAEAEVARKHKSRELRQAIAEDTVKAIQAQRKDKEARLKEDLKQYNAGRIAEGREARKEIDLYNQEGFAYSRHLAREQVKNRIEVLELDRTHYSKEIKKFQDQELNAGFLVDTLSSIENELNELRIDAELSQD